MRKLLRANLYRLRRSKLFWGCLLAMLVTTAVAMHLVCGQAAVMLQGGYIQSFDALYFRTLPYFALFLSVFMGLFLGTEYSDGTIRNKVIVGCSRGEMYLSSLLCCALATFLLYLAWIIGGILVGFPTLGVWRTGTHMAECLLVGLLSVLALTAIFTLIGQISSNKATTAVVTILTALVLLLAASLIYNALCEPEMISSGVTISADGTVDMGEQIPNSSYVGGTMRAVFGFLLILLPTGQEIWLADEAVVQPWAMMGLSAAVIVVVTACGLAAFRRKDLK